MTGESGGVASALRVRIAGPDSQDRIDRYVEAREETSIYHRWGTGSVVERSFGHRYRCLFCERDDGTVAGILPLVHMKSRLFGNLLVSMPFFNYGGVCADDAAGRDLLIAETVRLAEGLGAGHLELRQEKPLGNGFPVKTDKVSMRLPLPGSPEDLWKSLPSKLRSQIRKPQKEGMTARIGRHEEIDGFYEVFSINMTALGTPVYPKRFFRAMLDEFPENTWICSVYAGHKPVASGFLVGFKDRLEIPWASSLRQYNRLSPNMLLYWDCLSFGCGRGYAVFDFGRSTAGGGTYRFKEQWGAAEVPLFWHYWVRGGGSVPDLSPGNPKYKLAIEIWKRLPVSFNRIVGPRIVRSIP
jgi:serine/alanine adding enzyme